MGRFSTATALVRIMSTSVAATAIAASTATMAAPSTVRHFDLPAQTAEQGIPAFAKQADMQIVIQINAARGHRTNAVRGDYLPQEALKLLLENTGLAVFDSPPGMKATIVRAVASADPVTPSEPAVAQASPNDIIVTAQKRRESIQDVPIAISAFTQETLDKQKIEGGPDLLKAVPNLTFSKSNFAGYNLEIRGIGTKAISVTTDPGVAVNFNSTTLITNRFFEQEFFDLERVEVLRGPQGTLYGRNATGGVVNIISAKPDLTKFDGYIKSEVGNFQSRRAQGAINIPVIPDLFGIRLAGAYTNRNGFTTNDITMHRIDGRDLYTTRVTASLKPSTRLRSDFIWERFSENDNRTRTAKQLCHRDNGPADFGAIKNLSAQARGYLSQGCKPGSLYDDGAYGVPNGLSLPYVQPTADDFSFLGFKKQGSDTEIIPILARGRDPYSATTQTHDLRRISSVSDPIYRAKADVFEWNSDWDVFDNLRLTSQTAFNRDRYYSNQDYNRFNTVPVFNSSDGLLSSDQMTPALPLTPGGYYDDPQLGKSNRLVAQDLVTARTKQISQELRLTTTGRGPLQGSIGANYTYYRNITDYYVFINTLSAFSQGATLAGNASVDPSFCNNGSIVFAGNGPAHTNTPAADAAGCLYIDPNPLSRINGQGHNYFGARTAITSTPLGFSGTALIVLVKT